MHAYMRQSHFPETTNPVAEGLCQVASVLWLESQAVSKVRSQGQTHAFLR